MLGRQRMAFRPICADLATVVSLTWEGPSNAQHVRLSHGRVDSRTEGWELDFMSTLLKVWIVRVGLATVLPLTETRSNRWKTHGCHANCHSPPETRLRSEQNVRPRARSKNRKIMHSNAWEILFRICAASTHAKSGGARTDCGLNRAGH